MQEYRGVLIEDAGLFKADWRHPLVLAGFHVLKLRRADTGAQVDSMPYRPRPTARAAAFALARRRVDAYAESGFTWAQ